MVKITDKKILGRINEIIPTIGQTLINTKNTNTGKKIATEVANYNKRYDGNLYEAIIPPKAELFNSKAIKGANRGGYMNQDKSLGQANFKHVKNLEVSNINKVANIASSAVNLTSMVVGQYYMAEISVTLDSLRKEISDVKNFQNTEFKSKIGSLLKKIMIISEFKEEVISNSQITNIELTKLYDYEDEADQLLLHINMDMSSLINSKDKFDINTYKNAVEEYDLLGRQQEILLKIMEESASLKYFLNRGETTVEYCNAKYQNSFEQTHAIRKELKTWHQHQIETLKIDVDKSRSKRVYFLSDKIAPVIGLMNDDLNYHSLSTDTVDSVKAQINNESLTLHKTRNVFDTNTRLLIKDDEVYYLPDEIKEAN